MKLPVLVALLALTGCADAPQIDLASQVAGGQLAYGAPTLAAAKRAFFDIGDSAGGDDGGGDGGSYLLGPQDHVALHGLPPTVTQASMTRQDDLGDMVLRSSVLAGYQYLNGSLPQGIGVLTDPMEIEIWARSLAVQMTLGRQQALPLGLHLDTAAGLGVAQVTAATHLQSALIDLRGSSRQTLPYATAEARLAGPAGMAILGSLIVFRSGATELRLGVTQSF